MIRPNLGALFVALSAASPAFALPQSQTPLVAPAVQYSPPSGNPSTVQSELDWSHGGNLWRPIVTRSSLAPSARSSIAFCDIRKV